MVGSSDKQAEESPSDRQSRRSLDVQRAARELYDSAKSSPLLTEQTRRSRKMLVLFSAIELLMVWVNLVPKEITAIGVKFDSLGQSSLIVSGALVIGYFLLMFHVQAQTDSRNWTERFKSVEKTMKEAKLNLEYELDTRFGLDAWHVHLNSPRRFTDVYLPQGLAVLAISSAMIDIALT